MLWSTPLKFMIEHSQWQAVIRVSCIYDNRHQQWGRWQEEKKQKRKGQRKNSGEGANLTKSWAQPPKFQLCTNYFLPVASCLVSTCWNNNIKINSQSRYSYCYKATLTNCRLFFFHVAALPFVSNGSADAAKTMTNIPHKNNNELFIQYYTAPRQMHEERGLKERERKKKEKKRNNNHINF